MFIRFKNLIIGKAKDLGDQRIFHNLSLIAFFAWVGLGADGLSSSCYGPEEAFLALGEHRYLGIFVALLTAGTVFLISASYCEIIELFPGGGGGYLVASKLLHPTVGMFSGCALLIDYVLTISISIASGTDALFSFLPASWHDPKLIVAIGGVVLLMAMNMRGVKESIIPLTPIFLVFVFSHIFAVIYAIVTHSGQVSSMVSAGAQDIQSLHGQVGMWGILFLILRAYSLGAGTFTGIESISNGMPILREPKVATAKRTMQYMSFSLAFTVAGLMIAYLLLDVHKDPNKTLNAALFEGMTAAWPQPWGHVFVLVLLISEAALLFVAAQAGFLSGPRVLANMATDRWVPTSFSALSDRLVTQNGVILMGVLALATLILTNGSVKILVILYSINVFITFSLSQAGMVRHWWQVRREQRNWWKKMLINGPGFLATTFVLCAVVILKFHEGGWVTILITGVMAIFAGLIKRHYLDTIKLLKRLNPLMETVGEVFPRVEGFSTKPDPTGKTAVVLVNGFNGLGLHTMMAVTRYFGKAFKNFVFIQVGVVDAGNFKGAQEMDRLKAVVHKDLDRYVDFMRGNGYYSQCYSAMGTDVTLEVERLAQEIIVKYPDCVFFGGQLVFPHETFMTRLLHNHTVFTIQKRLYREGIPFMVLPVRV